MQVNLQRYFKHQITRQPNPSLRGQLLKKERTLGHQPDVRCSQYDQADDGPVGFGNVEMKLKEADVLIFGNEDLPGLLLLLGEQTIGYQHAINLILRSHLSKLFCSVLRCTSPHHSMKFPT